MKRTHPLLWTLRMSASRRMLWLLLLPLIAIFTWALFFADTTPQFQTSQPTIEFPDATVAQGDVLQQVLAAGRQAEVEGIDLARLHNDLQQPYVQVDPQTGQRSMELPLGETGAYDFLKELPNLKVIDLGYDELSAEVLQPLIKIEQLKVLWFGSSLKLLDLTHMQQMQVLDLGPSRIDGDLATLARFPRLHTLIISNFENLTDATLADIARIPQLRTLVISPVYHEGNATPTGKAKFITDAGLRSLAESATLERLYVGRHGNWSIPLETARRLLPDVDVRRGYYNVTRATFALFYLMGALAPLFTLVYMHVAPILGQSTAWVTPRFSRPHLTVAGVLILGSIAASTILWWQRDADLLAALTASCFLVTITLCWGYAFLVVLPRQDRLPSSLRALVGIFVGLFFPAMVLLPQRLPVPLDTFLVGETPRIINVMVLVASLGALYWLAVRLVMSPRVYAASNTQPALALADINTSMTPNTQADAFGKSRGVRRLDAAVLATIAAGFHQHDTRRRRRLWNGAQLRNIYFMFPLMMVFYVFFYIFGEWSTGGTAFSLAKTLPVERTPFVAIAVMFAFFSTAGPGLLWKGRMPILVHESLRPLNRQALRADIFAVTRQDGLKLLSFVIVPLAMAFVFGTPNSRTLLTLTILVGLLIATAGASYGCMMLMLLVRRSWVIVLASLCVNVAVVSLFVVYLTFPNVFDRPLQSTDYLPLIAVMTILGIFATAWAWRRWGTIEFARLLR